MVGAEGIGPSWWITHLRLLRPLRLPVPPRSRTTDYARNYRSRVLAVDADQPQGLYQHQNQDLQLILWISQELSWLAKEEEELVLFHRSYSTSFYGMPGEI